VPHEQPDHASEPLEQERSARLLARQQVLDNVAENWRPTAIPSHLENEEVNDTANLLQSPLVIDPAVRGGLKRPASFGAFLKNPVVKKK